MKGHILEMFEFCCLAKTAHAQWDNVLLYPQRMVIQHVRKEMERVGQGIQTFLKTQHCFQEAISDKKETQCALGESYFMPLLALAGTCNNRQRLRHITEASPACLSVS